MSVIFCKSFLYASSEDNRYIFQKILAVLQPAPYISFFFKLYLKPREGHRGTTQLILQARSSET